MNNELIRLQISGALLSPYVKSLYDALIEKQTEYDVIDTYWNGKHPLTFATEKFNNAFGQLFRAMADNYCRRVCNALSDYLQLKKLSSSNDVYDKKLGDFWEQSRIDFNSGQIHTSAFKYGDGYAIIAKNSRGKDRLYKQNSRSVRVMYDDDEPDTITLAIKLWQRQDNFWRLNIYTPGRLFRFVSEKKTTGETAPAKLSAFVEYAEGEGADQVTRAACIPVFHFPNEPGNDGNGMSELNDIIPQQDILNKSLCDMLVAMEYQAFKQRWATGIEVDFDDDGNPKAPAVNAIDRLLFSGNEEARFGEFGQIDLKGFLEVSEAARHEIARLSCLPLHHLGMLSGGWPSGEAMKTADIPLTAKKRDRQICWGNEWEAVACYIAGIDPQDMNESEIEAEWEDVSPRNDLAEAQADQAEAAAALLKVQLGVGKSKVLEELGYNKDEIEAFDTENANDLAAMQGKMIDYFNRAGAGTGSGAIPLSSGGSNRPASLPAPANVPAR